MLTDWKSWNKITNCCI